MDHMVQELGKRIHSSQKILLINHIRMDGDAWGSLGGLFLVLKEMGKEVRAINDENVPESLSFLGHKKIIEPELQVAEFDPDIIISLDASDTQRLGESYLKWKHIFDKKPFIVIDHHISNTGFGSLSIIDAEASSTCELLVHTLMTLGLEKYITPEAATFFYTGIQTDSNMYFNTNTRPSTLRAGAILIELGADFRLPIYELYQKRTKNQIQFWSSILKKIQYFQDGQICACIMTPEDVYEGALESSEISHYFKSFISEILINIEGVKIAFIIYPLSKEENKVSLRSQKGYDVAQICESFGGGGHKQAAGFQSKEDIEVLKELLLKSLTNKQI